MTKEPGQTAETGREGGPGQAGGLGQKAATISSRQPFVQPAVRAQARNSYSLRSWARPDGVEHHAVTVPRRGLNRERGRETIMKLLTRAAAQDWRAAFIVTYTDRTTFAIGGRGGYAAQRALEQCRVEQGDPFEWLEVELYDRLPTGWTEVMIGVDISTWPAAP